MDKIKVLNIIQDSIVDGVGLRATIFFAGCPHRCKGCHNPESWNIGYGTDYTMDEIINQIQLNPITNGVTLSGGDPMYQAEVILPLVSRLKELGYDIWIYTGYEYDQIIADEHMFEILKLSNVLVDGKFNEELKDLTLPFRGSSNQRIIDVPKSILDSKIRLWER